ncbi:mannose-1-phosphate guanylyltransferase/mannose-6-phosphate isomerase [Rhodoplanes serenus]|uniref:mannose-1-phosphate guanylyltransferase/mannose-6-phosphate isomerase n=1 Tax=Rhodoplanes serenus TaxID=200615 RepID=UPI000DAC28A2|nr:mannose-1-phosphate guanylyltransferase/mannose-6-phosphate isomerase [Rhodoplanes serenus]RAI35929.1 mannose-1-phosphate guanylyltransferase/mannose-6-phosphate isomerase [Rhodoplanes serenus]
MALPKIIPLLLAGGSGTRLWPVSRDAMPKQFLPLVGERSTYQQALARVSSPALFAPPIVMTASDFRFFARSQAEALGIDATVVLEPMRRDSGPAIAAGAALARRRDPDAVVLAIAADHVILDQELFEATCAAGLEAAVAGHIVTFGIAPSAPKTSYGYIRRGAPLGPAGVAAVDAFVEKPDAATAARYVADGYLWNSGNFLFGAETLLAELTRFEPEMARAVEGAVEEAAPDLGFARLNAEAFGRAPQKSIDYAVMERTDKAAVVEGRFRWSDIGSWDAVFDIAPRDDAGNVTSGPVATMDTEGCVIHAEDRLTVALGVKDLVVVTTPDAVLVLPRDRAEDVKPLVARLKAERRNEATEHRLCHRPWGHYDSLDRGARYQVKRIVVSPGAQLSLQRHYHRAEHWVVVRGTAEVTTGDNNAIVHENESVFIPIGAVHRLANPGKIPLELIEVQTGSYLGEDDIVRLDDVYRRD